MKSAPQETMPQASKQDVVHSRKNQPCFDSSCTEALCLKAGVYQNLHSTAAEKLVAEWKLHFVTERVKGTWTQKRNAELCELSAKDPNQSWKAYKAPQSNACPVKLSAQFKAFRALMRAKPQSAPQRPGASAVSTSCSDDACLNADVMDNTSILRSLIDKHKQSRQKESWQAVLLCGLQESVQCSTVCCVVAGAGGIWCSWHTTSQRCGRRKAFLPSSDVSWSKGVR